jgi:hypothetical protein
LKLEAGSAAGRRNVELGRTIHLNAVMVIYKRMLPPPE